MSRLTSRSAGAIGILVAATLFAGCGTGQVAQTANKQSAIEGANAKIGDMLVRNMLIERPEDGDETVWKTGSEVPLSLQLVNQAEESDRLVGVVSTVASGVALRSGSGEEAASPTPSASPTGSASPTESPTASESASPSGSAPASPSPSGSASPGAGCSDRVSVEVQAGERVTLAQDAEQYIVLCATVEVIKAGQPVGIVLVFEKAGRQQISVPLHSPEEPLERETPEEHEGD